MLRRKTLAFAAILWHIHISACTPFAMYYHGRSSWRLIICISFICFPLLVHVLYARCLDCPFQSHFAPQRKFSIIAFLIFALSCHSRVTSIMVQRVIYFAPVVYTLLLLLLSEIWLKSTQLCLRKWWHHRRRSYTIPATGSEPPLCNSVMTNPSQRSSPRELSSDANAEKCLTDI